MCAAQSSDDVDDLQARLNALFDSPPRQREEKGDMCGMNSNSANLNIASIEEKSLNDFAEYESRLSNQKSMKCEES